MKPSKYEQRTNAKCVLSVSAFFSRISRTVLVSVDYLDSLILRNNFNPNRPLQSPRDKKKDHENDAWDDDSTPSVVRTLYYTYDVTAV
jgi:hypothetical protein